jgi:hypothetical protein
MSGLGELGNLPGFATGGAQVTPSDSDNYEQIEVTYPSVTVGYIGTAKGTTAAGVVAVTQVNQLCDWPRNLLYQITGAAAGVGGTFTSNVIDQFGQAVTEKIGFGSAASGGSAYGTTIVAKWLSGSVSLVTSGAGSIGTVTVGFGTQPGSAWFGLLNKIGGTSDVKNITWYNSATPTTLNGGTNIGTLVSTSLHAFQGTSGVAVTDMYSVILKPTYSNLGKPNMAGL